jgi:hypothetical protein
METTIHRGMEIQAYQPVQLLLDFMMEEVKDEFYSKFIMLDLQEIIAHPTTDMAFGATCIKDKDHIL